MRLLILAWVALVLPLALGAQEPADSAAQAPFARYWGALYAGGATGEFAPSLIGSLNHGKTPYRSTALLEAGIVRDLDLGRRFSWGFGFSGLAGTQGGNDYARWNADVAEWTDRHLSAPNIWLQQLYGELKYRGVFLTVGMKEYEPPLINARLSSGDMVFSGNTRPIPQVRAGFVDFQNIPFTRGWVQIQGELAFGKMTDNAFMKSHYNYFNYHITLGSLYNYKRCFFRTMPSQPLSVTVGMQAAGFFGGKAYYYRDGKMYKTLQFDKNAKAFFDMALPVSPGGEDYYLGQSLGSWDFQARWRFRNGDELKGYFQWLWEDGSGIGKLNGWDGLWGIEYRRAGKHWLNGAVAEYIDLRNQSGPLHWATADNPGTTIPSEATGRDNYYNNAYYNAWANYGMAMGSPFMMAPLYNLDGYPAFISTRTNGFHLGADGNITRDITWRWLLSYARGLGNFDYPFYKARSTTSMLVEAGWDAHCLLPGLSVNGQLAFDAGNLRPNTFGALVTLTYTGALDFGR